MELLKKSIKMNRIKGKVISQITLDDDINVSDKLPDISNKITENGEVIIEQILASQNKINIKGKLNFKMLYRSAMAEVDIKRLDGSLQFDEIINLDGIDEGDLISVDFEIDDLSISIINSRKISVKAVITVVAIAENSFEEELVTDIEGDSINYIKEPMEITQMSIKKKDLLRVKEEINLVSGKMNIDKIIWNTASLNKQEVRLLDDRVIISGEIDVFILYVGEEGPLQWVETSVPFSGNVDINGGNDKMIPSVELKLHELQIDAKPDVDGEQRVFTVEGVIDVNIKLYEDFCFDIVCDASSKKIDLVANTKKIDYETLLVKNVTRCKINEKIEQNAKEGWDILQICSSKAEVKIDDTYIVEGGIKVEGALGITILYICSEDTNPLRCICETIPFEQKIDISQINDNSEFYIKGVLEQLVTNMSGKNEIDVRANVLLDCIVFNKCSKEILSNYVEKELDMEKISNMPGIIGYVCKKEDTLFKIAKEYYTTEEEIRKYNDIKDDLYPGQMLMLVKEM